MRRITILAGIFWCVLLLQAEKAAVLADLLNPRYLVVDSDQIIVSDYPHVYLYSLENLSLTKRIGNEGVGPGEFHIIQANMNLKERGLVISVCQDHLVVNSTARLAYFSRKGDFIGEKKLPYGINAKFLSHGDRILGFLPIRDGKLSVALFDSDLNKQKEILNCDYWFNLQSREQANFFDRASDTLLVSLSGDKIFMARGDSPSLAIHVFDFEGSQLYSIEHDLEKLRIPQSFVDEIHAHFKIKFTRGSDYFIKTLNLPKQFPAVRDFRIADDRIYVLTFKTVSLENEVIVFDVKGNLLEKKFLPVKEMNPERLYPFSFSKNKLYQLIFNEETENWELHITDID